MQSVPPSPASLYDSIPVTTALIRQEENSTLRPAERYTIYDGKDTTGTLPPSYQLILARAAAWLCVDEDYLSVTLEQIEKRMLRFPKDLRDNENSSDASTDINSD